MSSGSLARPFLFMMNKESQNEPRKSRRMAVLLLISLQLVSSVKSSSYQSIVPSNRLAFYPRGGGSHSTTSSHASTLLLKRRNRSSTATRSASVQNVGWRRKAAPAQTIDYEEEYYDYNPQQPQTNDEVSLDELRAQLGPIGLFVSNSIELVVVTVGSYISGGLLGYVGGGVMGFPSTIFGKDLGGISQRFSALHSKAFTSCKSWATLSAAFTGFHKLAWLLRGGVEDGWNAVWGSALTGAFLNRAGGPQAMIQGGATYAGFTYFLDKFFGATPGSRQGQPAQELLYTDVPIDD